MSNCTQNKGALFQKQLYMVLSVHYYISKLILNSGSYYPGIESDFEKAGLVEPLIFEIDKT